MQIYQWSNLPEAESEYYIPANWNSWDNSASDENCFVDNAQRVLPNATSTKLSNNGPGTCVAFCTSGNYTLAGLENGNECWCGMAYAGWSGPNRTETYTCNTACPEAPNLDCGGPWSLTLYYQYF
jgi:glucan endo-1,3-alpha-glucosidase